MLWLEDIEREDNLVVAKWHISEWAKGVCAQMDNLDKRLKTVEGVMEHGHHEAPVVTVVGSLMPEREPADWTEEDTCECLECGETHKIVHPRKGMDTCRCDEARQLTEEVAELRRRLAEKPVGLLAEIERLAVDAALGALVRKMPRWSHVGPIHDSCTWWFDGGEGHFGCARTPEGAIEAGLEVRR